MTFEQVICCLVSSCDTAEMFENNHFDSWLNIVAGGAPTQSNIFDVCDHEFRMWHAQL